MIALKPISTFEFQVGQVDYKHPVCHECRRYFQPIIARNALAARNHRQIGPVTITVRPRFREIDIDDADDASESCET